MPKPATSCLMASMSLSSWRAWIEIVRDAAGYRRAQSLSSWRAWIEIITASFENGSSPSLSSWRAWIEMLPMRVTFRLTWVALLMESVD